MQYLIAELLQYYDNFIFCHKKWIGTT